MTGGFDAQPWLLVRNDLGQWLVGVPLSGAGPKGAPPPRPKAAAPSPLQQRIAAAGGGNASSSNSATAQRRGPHSNLIQELQAFVDGGGQPTGWFASAGLDGAVALWDVSQSFSGASQEQSLPQGAAAGPQQLDCEGQLMAVGD